MSVATTNGTLSQLSLADAPLNRAVTVRGIRGESAVSKRFNALGLRPGCQPTVVRRAPFGGPIIVAFAGTELLLRRQDAELIDIHE